MLNEYETKTCQRFVRHARDRMESFGITEEFLTSRVPFHGGIHEQRLQDAIRLAGECLIYGEIRIALRHVIRARGVDMPLSSFDAEALTLMTQFIERRIAEPQDARAAEALFSSHADPTWVPDPPIALPSEPPVVSMLVAEWVDGTTTPLPVLFTSNEIAQTYEEEALAVFPGLVRVFTQIRNVITTPRRLAVRRVG